MDSFLGKYNFLHLSDVFTSNGVKDEEFLALDDSRVLEILKEQPHLTLLNFISKLNFEKGSTATNSNQSRRDIPAVVEAMDVTEIDHSPAENLTFSETGFSVIGSPIGTEIVMIEGTSEMEKDTFIYKQNGLFHLLGDSLQGRIVLGKYRQVSRELDYCKLKDIVIFAKMQDDTKNYKIKPREFEDLRDQIIELFPTEDPEFFYVPYYINAAKQSMSARGLLYNHYKYIRKQLRIAGILTNQSENDDTFQEAEEQNSNCLALSDPNRAPYSAANVLQEWGESYAEREKLLIVSNKRKDDTVQKYFKSFCCLRSPLGISLLESDFERIFDELGKQRTPDANGLAPRHSTLFSAAWPRLSERIIAHFKKSKIKEVKAFFDQHKELIDEGTHNSVLALLLLPFCVTVPKSVKTAESNPLSIPKARISQCFILHVQEHENLEREKEEFEKFLKTHEQPILPYVIFCGKIERIYQTYVILNDEKYEYEDPVKAVEATFKCLTALRHWPYLCDYVWVFIQKFVFEIDSDKSYAAISKLIVQLKKG